MKKKIAAYIRLSKKDQELQNSISNQKKLICHYLKEKTTIVFYVDDGYSGTDFHRPSFLKLLEDVKKEKIELLIVKDLSRLGRNYLQTGLYLETFLTYHVRFISINDGIDTSQKETNFYPLLLPFKNLLNDVYTRDISMKIKTSLNSKKRKGEYVLPFAPYGYLKDKKDKHKLVIDKKTSSIVKQIFSLAFQNYSFSSIAKKLNEQKVLSPVEYRRNSSKTNSHWSSATISRLLQNQFYAQNSPSIIDPILFQKIQEKCFSRHRYPDKNGKNHLFSGYLKCAVCHKAMLKYPSIKNRKTNFIYYCSTYRKTKKKECRSIKIKKDILEEFVLKEIKEYIYKIGNFCQKQERKIGKNWKFVFLQEITNSTNLNYKRKENAKNCLLSDLKKKIISQEEYLFYFEELKKELKEIEENQKRYQKEDYFDWIDVCLKYKRKRTLSQEMLEDLVVSIDVFSDKEIKVRFKYEKEFQELNNI